MLWGFIPFSSAGALYGGEMGLLLLLGLASLGSYGVIYAGWASNSKYALLGAFRAVAQFVSYEILFSVLFLPLLAASGSANLLTLVQQQLQLGWFSYLVPLWLLAFLVVLAETNRTPFDLPEAEAELVAGFNVEYSSLLFAFFFLAEYSSMGFFAALLATLFFGGYAAPWSSAAAAAPLLRTAPLPRPLALEGWPELAELASSLAGCSAEALLLALKVQLICAAFIGVRASLPRKRFDQLVLLCWKYLFPLVLALVLALVGLTQAVTLALLPLPQLTPTVPPPQPLSKTLRTHASAGSSNFRPPSRISPSPDGPSAAPCQRAAATGGAGLPQPPQTDGCHRRHRRRCRTPGLRRGVPQRLPPRSPCPFLVARRA
jgi:NADH-ubiquinone oxidoreductase chain 1